MLTRGILNLFEKLIILFNSEVSPEFDIAIIQSFFFIPPRQITFLFVSSHHRMLYAQLQLVDEEEEEGASTTNFN